MLKFKYKHLTNTLSYQTEPSELWYQIPEDQQFIRFNGQGFTLEPPNHWIQLTVYESKIKAFYKQVKSPFPQLEPNDFFSKEEITYFRKYLAKEEEIIFTFSAKDEVEKAEGRWIRKGVNYE